MGCICISGIKHKVKIQYATFFDTYKHYIRIIAIIVKMFCIQKMEMKMKDEDEDEML